MGNVINSITTFINKVREWCGGKNEEDVELEEYHKHENHFTGNHLDQKIQHPSNQNQRQISSKKFSAPNQNNPQESKPPFLVRQQQILPIISQKQMPEVSSENKLAQRHNNQSNLKKQMNPQHKSNMQKVNITYSDKKADIVDQRRQEAQNERISKLIESQINESEGELQNYLKSGDIDDIAFAYTRCSLAHRTHSPKKAIQYGSRALKAYQSLPINSYFEEVITVQNNLGFLYAAQGNYRQAIKQFQEVLDLQRNYFSQLDERTIATKKNLDLARLKQRQSR